MIFEVDLGPAEVTLKAFTTAAMHENGDQNGTFIIRARTDIFISIDSNLIAGDIPIEICALDST